MDSVIQRLNNRGLVGTLMTISDVTVSIAIHVNNDSAVASSARIPRDPKSVCYYDASHTCPIEAILKHLQVDCKRLEGSTYVNSLAIIKITGLPRCKNL